MHPSSQVVTLSSVLALSNDSKPLVWKEFGNYLDKKVDIVTTSHNDSAVTHHFRSASDELLLSQVVKYQICNLCQRPIGEKSLASHYPRCVEMKLRSNDDHGSANGSKRKRGRMPRLLDVEASLADLSTTGTPMNGTPAPGTPTGSTTPARPKKKYKKSQSQKEKEAANAAAAAAAAAAGDGPRRKKITKSKTQAKLKGPIDVERQCGVPLPSGGFCARLLTCKTHSMGAKRAVPGRLAPYDVLLQQYQKRNQAKMAQTNALAAQRRDGPGMDYMDEGGVSLRVLDADEETHLVLEGLSKNYPMPLERKVMVLQRSRHRFLYMREAYANALITSGLLGDQNDSTLANQAISGSIGGLQGRCALVNVDRGNGPTQSFALIPGEMYQIRAPLRAIGLTAQYNVMQQQMFQQQVMKMQQMMRKNEAK